MPIGMVAKQILDFLVAHPIIESSVNGIAKKAKTAMSHGLDNAGSSEKKGWNSCNNAESKSFFYFSVAFSALLVVSKRFVGIKYYRCVIHNKYPFYIIYLK